MTTLLNYIFGLFIVACSFMVAGAILWVFAETFVGTKHNVFVFMKWTTIVCMGCFITIFLICLLAEAARTDVRGNFPHHWTDHRGW